MMKITQLLKRIFLYAFGTGNVKRSEMLIAVANDRETSEFAVLESMLPPADVGRVKEIYSEYLKTGNLPPMVIQQCRGKLNQM